MENYIKFLKSIDLFKCFSYEEIANLFTTNLCRIKEYKKNSVIYLQNEMCVSFDIILKGTITIQKIDAHGNVLTISNFTAGDGLGENLLFSHKNAYPMTIIAKQNTVLMHIEKALILKLCQDNIDFLNKFLQSISDKTLILTDKINSLSMKSIRKCIVDYLIYESYAQNSKTVKLELTKKELAEKFGIQRPSLSRELNKMRKDGLIEYDAYSIIILDMELLTESD